MTAVELLIFKYQFGNPLEKTISKKELRNVGASETHFQRWDEAADTAIKKRIEQQYAKRFVAVSDNTRTAYQPKPLVQNQTKYPAIQSKQTFIGPSNKPFGTPTKLSVPASIIDANKVTIGLGAFGFAHGGKTVIIEYAAQSGELCEAAGKYLKFCKNLNTGVSYLGIAVSIYGGASDPGEWKNHHTADLFIAGGSLFLTGPVGWAVGGAYFVTDLGVQYYTGKSITENLLD